MRKQGVPRGIRASVARRWGLVVGLVAVAGCVVPGAAAQAATSQGQAIVAAAAAMAGKPYCLDGGNTAGPTHGDGGSGCTAESIKGFDCSGLALYAVSQGTDGEVRLPHKASEEAMAGGQVITNQADLQPGDLVFFGGGSLDHAVHVGIYAGGGEMWDANNYDVRVQKHSLAWEEHGLRFDGGVRYWHSNASAPTTPSTNTGTGTGGSTSQTPAPTSPSTPTSSETSGSVVNTRTDYSNAGGTEGPSIPSNATVEIQCKVTGFEVADGNTWWYQIASSPWSDAYYASADAFYNNGATSGSLIGTPFVDTNVPTCAGSPLPPGTYAETSGSVVHTWTDYSDAGGTEGPSIPSNATVQIQCKVTGFEVADGNIWWYQIASSPWSDAYYASADAFYNNGATSGSLIATPFADPNVPNC